MKFERPRRWVVWTALLIFIVGTVLIVWPLHTSSTVWYYSICLHCGKETGGKRTAHFGVEILHARSEIRPTAVSKALSDHVVRGQPHEWAESVLTVIHRSFRGGMNGRGGLPLVKRLNQDTEFIRELEGMPEGPELWRSLVELERSNWMDFAELPFAGLQPHRDSPPSRPPLKEWWAKNRATLLEKIDAAQ